MNLFQTTRPGTGNGTTIGFLGLDRGLGTTFLSIALANYLVKWEGASAAVLCLSGRCEPEMLREFEKGEALSIYGVRYFPRIDSSNISDVLSLAYDYFILDLGCDHGKNLGEFLRCRRRYIVGSLVPWRLRDQERRMAEIQDYAKHDFGVEFLANGGNRHDKKYFSKTCGVPVASVPFMEDPFSVGAELRSFFSRFL